MKILFIEDDIMVLKAIQARMRATSLTCFYAQSLEEADRLSASHRFSIIISDYYLDKSNCMSFLEDIKTRHPDIRLFLTSADENIVDVSMKTVDGFVQKPVTADKISALLHDQSIT